MELKMRCDDCGARGQCMEIFGKYWPDRSNDGTGCNCPLGDLPVRAAPTVRPSGRHPAPPVRIRQRELFGDTQT